MLEKLKAIEERLTEVERQLSDPAVYADRERLTALSREQKELTPVVSCYRAYAQAVQTAEDAAAMLSDPELRELAQEELTAAKADMERLTEELKRLLLPRDPNDDKNIIMEIRAGAGGDEAALFAGDLFRMYTRYAEQKGWKVELMDSSPTGLGGFKEVVFMVSGTDVYSHMKFESGVHRVQRVPDTESQGRVHTSTVTVAVMPEAQEVDIELNPADIRVDTYRAGGAGAST